MRNKSYLPGDVVRVALSVKTLSGEPVDPGGVALVMQGPSARKMLVPAGAITKSDTGEYFSDFQIPPEIKAGTWAWRWEIAAPNPGVSEGTFVVQRSLIV